MAHHFSSRTPSVEAMAEHTRTLDFKIAFAIGLGTMIAAGIFSLSGTAVFRIGSTAVVAFVLAAVVASITAAAYSEFASIYSENGGGYLFTSRTFEDRPFLMYAIGMSLFLGYTGTTAFYLATMDEWFFGFLVPEQFHFLPPGTFGVLAALALGFLNARGTEESGAFQLIVTGAKVAVLLIFIGGMFASVGVGPAMAEFTNEVELAPIGTVSVAALAFITFFGFSAIAASAGEIIDPTRTVPRAIGASIVTVTVLYAFVIVAMVNINNVSGRLMRSPDEILQLGETAMGAVAQAFIPVTVAGVPLGQYLIVAGAIFSMVSASNASILAATGIGSLMGRQGQAPRRFSRIHPEYGTPFWSVTAATGLIVALIVVFMSLFGEHGYLAPIPVGLDLSVAGATLALEEFVLGLSPLTGFATLNLLLPLAVINAVLIASRRKFPDIERGFSVPGVPVVPVLGIVANLALIYNLPEGGIVTGVLLIVVLLAAYVVWGGAPDVEELIHEVSAPAGPTTDVISEGPAAAAGEADEPEPGDTGGDPGEPAPAANGAEPTEAAEPAESAAAEAETDRPRVLVPVDRPHRAARYVEVAAAFGRALGENPIVQLLNVLQLPDQTPHEVVADDAVKRAELIRDELAQREFDVEYTVEAHTSRDVGFDIVQTARTDGAGLIVMGYPEDHREITEKVEYDAPCDVLFLSDVEADDLSVVNVGAGGGPHHLASLRLVRSLGSLGSEVHVIEVTPTGDGGTAEAISDTIDELTGIDVETHSVSSASVADGLVDTAAQNGGVLLIGASRTRRLRRWVFGGTPDRVVDLAAAHGVPVMVYASESGIHSWLQDRLFPVTRYLLRLSGRGPHKRAYETEG
jgi:amino acid transporter/nucleotide-binding universal stress UspA family protein